MNHTYHTLRATAGLLSSAAALFAVTAMSAQTATPAENKEVLKLEKFVVTGSNIPMASDTKSVPVTLISQGEIEKTGLNANLLEVLQKRMPMLSGNGNLGTTSANTGSGATAGGSNASLRNLNTLVLLNGRRISDNGAGANGNRNFVDVSQIPVSAIERVEVLTDGASAIYGSDAIGGVINIILRSNFQGAEIGGRYGMNTEKGDYSEWSAYVVAGASNDKLSITVSGNWNKTEPLLQNDRSFSSPIVGRTATYSGVVGQGTSFPTAMLANGVNSPKDRNPVGLNATAPNLAALIANGTYVPADFASAAALLDISPYVTLIIEHESKAATADFNAKLVGQQLELFGDFLYSQNNSMSQLAAQPSTPNLTLPAGSPYNPLTIAFPQVAFRYLPAPRIFENDSKLVRYTAGFRGQINDDWKWETAYTYNQTDLFRATRNVLYLPNMNRAVAGGYNSAGVATPGGNYSRVITGFSETGGSFVVQPALDALARAGSVDPASMVNLLGVSWGQFIAKNNSLDVLVSGVVWDLPADKLRFAVGASARKESLSGTPDPNSMQTGPTARQWLGATFFDPFVKDRSVSAAFAEVRVPLAGEGWRKPGLYLLELDAAYRTEDYSDAGRSNVPKYGVVWQPINNEFTVRYSYSESFVAPTLYALYGPTTQGFTPTAVIPAVFGINGQAQQQTGSNPNLVPSTAKTHSFGFAWSPSKIRGLSVSIDYIKVDQKDLVGTVGAASILQDVDINGPASQFASQVSFINFPGTATAVPITAPHQLSAYLAAGNSANGIFVADTNRNIAGQKVEALDVAISYNLPTSAGTWDFSTTGTYFLSYQFQATPFQSYYQFAGHTTNGGVSSQGTIPGFRFYTTASWRKGNWSATIADTYIPEVVDIGPGGLTFAQSTTLQRVPVDSYHSVDLSVNYSIPAKTTEGWMSWLSGVKFTVGVNNVFDEMPPLAPQAWNDNNADISTYNPIGRLWYFSASAKF